MTATDPIYSSFKGDPDMDELAQYFVDEMPDRVREMSESFESQDWDRLKSVAHQLKGAAGGYGYEGVGAYAAALESSLKESTDDLNIIATELRALTDLCSRIAA